MFSLLNGLMGLMPSDRGGLNLTSPSKMLFNKPDSGEGREYNPNVYTSVGPLIGDDYDGEDLGNNAEDCDINLPEPEFQSGMILVGSDLKLLKVIHNERDLLSMAGLNINPTDDVRIMRNGSGEIVGAIAFGTKNMGQIKKIRYIDIDPDAIHFKKCLRHIIQTESSKSPLKFYNSDHVDIVRDKIPERFIRY